MDLGSVVDDIIEIVVTMCDGLSAVRLGATCHHFRRATRQASWVVVNEHDDLQSIIARAKNGTKLHVIGRHDIRGGNIVVKTNLYICGTGAVVNLISGARIVWCAKGHLANVRIVRHLVASHPVTCPNSAVCVRGLGRLCMQRSMITYVGDASSVNYGAYVDFGASLFLDHVAFHGIKGSCLRVDSGKVEARHTLFSIDGMYPAIIVTRG